MRKLVLEVEALRVETFDTAQPRAKAKGTVRAYDASDSQCCIYPGDYSWDCSLANCTNDCGLPSQATCEGPCCYPTSAGVDH